MYSLSIEKTPFLVRQELAKKVKEIRKSKKYSQQELAVRSNVSLGSYKRFEQTGHISLDALLRIVFVLNRLDEFDKLLMPDNMEEIEKLFNDRK